MLPKISNPALLNAETEVNKLAHKALEILSGYRINATGKPKIKPIVSQIEEIMMILLTKITTSAKFVAFKACDKKNLSLNCNFDLNNVTTKVKTVMKPRPPI